MEYREYQNEALDTIKGLINTNKKRSLVVLPTAAGKTVVFCKLIEYLNQFNKKILIVTHKRQLVDQLKERYLNDDNKNILNTTIQGYKFNFNPDFIIIDECHAVNYEKGRYRKLIDTYPNSFVAGFTATPYRLDNGLVYGEDKIWKKIDYMKTVADLLELGYLTHYRVIVPKEFKDNESLRAQISDKEIAVIMKQQYLIKAVIDAYIKYCKNKKTIIFATDIKHADLLSKQIPYSRVVHSKLNAGANKNIINLFKNNEINCLININKLTEGFDDTGIDIVLLARPTQSIALHRQSVGRGLRLHPGKKECLIIDLVSNFWRCGDLSDEVEEKSKKLSYFVCDECFEVTFKSTNTCDVCGFVRKAEKRESIADRKKKANNDVTTAEYTEYIKSSRPGEYVVHNVSKPKAECGGYALTLTLKDMLNKTIKHRLFIKDNIIFTRLAIDVSNMNYLNSKVEKLINEIKYKKVSIKSGKIFRECNS